MVSTHGDMVEQSVLDLDSVASLGLGANLDLGVTWVCVHDLTWHQNDLKVD